EGARPGWAALKFVLYTLAGSLLMLVGVIGEYVATGHQTFDLAQLAKLAPSPAWQFGLFFVFALAFAIKTPLFPFHSWLPDAYNVQGQQGALLQMVNHGIIIAALFLIVGWITETTGVRDRSAVAGLALRMPVMAGVFAIVTFAALGLPGLNSFVGEFMTLLGAWQRAPVLAVLGAIG